MPNVPASLAIVCADFHQEIAEVMIAAAEDEAKTAGLETISVTRVPGSLEAPLVIDQLLENGAGAVVALGFIEKGETLHGEVMGHVVYKSLIDLQLKHKKPIGLGIIGPGATPEQAEVRKETAARGAVKAVIRSYQTLGES